MQTWQFVSPAQLRSDNKPVSNLPRVKAVSHLPDLITSSKTVSDFERSQTNNNSNAVAKSISNISNSMSDLINTITKTIHNILPSLTDNSTHSSINSSIPKIKSNTWRWYNKTKNKWVYFMPIISEQIDDFIHYQWRHTNNNPIIFQLTSGSWQGDSKNRNIYSVHAYLDQTRTTITNIYRINNNTNVCNKIKRTTLSPLLPPILINYKCKNMSSKDNNSESIDHSQMDISQFKYVGEQNINLIFGYIRNIEDNNVNILSRHISLSVYKICSIFHSGINIKLGNKIDVCDRSGKWFLSEIKKHKKIEETINYKCEKLTKKQRNNINKLCKLEGIFIHYCGYDCKYDEWIFIEDNTICRCHGQCVSNIYKHRLSPPNTQSKLCNPN